MNWESWVIHEHERVLREKNFFSLHRYVLASIVVLGLVAWVFVEIAL